MFLHKISATLPKKLTRICNVSPKRMSSHFIYTPDKQAPISGPTIKMNMFQAINNALDISLQNDESALLFGEDVAFGGVFRCSMNLQVNNPSTIRAYVENESFNNRKNMGKTECLILHYVNKESLDLELE